MAHTESGSTYTFEKRGTKWFVQRSNPASESELRRDGEWVQMVAAPNPIKGYKMTLILEPLGDGNVTIRMTTPVTSIT